MNSDLSFPSSLLALWVCVNLLSRILMYCKNCCCCFFYILNIIFFILLELFWGTKKQVYFRIKVYLRTKSVHFSYGIFKYISTTIYDIYQFWHKLMDSLSLPLKCPFKVVQLKFLFFKKKIRNIMHLLHQFMHTLFK